MRTAAWPLARLGEVGGDIRTGPFGSQLHRSDYTAEADGIPVVMPKDMTGGYIDYTSIARVTPEKAASLSQHIMRVGDIALARRGDIGRCALVRIRDDGAFCGTGSMRISVSGTALLPEFLHRYLCTDEAAASLSGMAIGATMPNLNGDIVRSLLVPVPPSAVQHRVVAILWAYDNLIESNTRRIQILEEMVRAIYREWFVEFRFPGHEGVGMVDSELGSIPDGWRVRSIGSVADLVARGISPKYSENSARVVVNQRCIRNGRLSLENARGHGNDVPPPKLLRQGDVLINSTGEGTLGRVAQVLEHTPDTTVDSHVTIIRPKFPVVQARFGVEWRQAT